MPTAKDYEVTQARRVSLGMIWLFYSCVFSSVGFSDMYVLWWLSKLLVLRATHLSRALFRKTLVDPGCLFSGYSGQL